MRVVDEVELVAMLKRAMAAVVLGDDWPVDPLPTLLVDDRDLEEMARIARRVVCFAYGIDT